MTAITYIAKNSLISGHTTGESYNLEPQLHEHNYISETNGTTQRALDGSYESLINNRDKLHDLVIGGINETDLEDWDEFIDSVDNKEIFTLDITGTISVPVNAITVQLVNKPGFTRLGTLSKFRINLRVREV